ncbi:MAG: type I glyceraldehyde-3-phosphate dehydrogenase [Oscillospiraceae bacterium]
MSIKIGINGFGRIGRVCLRAALERGEEFEVRGINVRNADLDYMVYMMRYDTVFGRYPGKVETDGKALIINGKSIPVFSESDAERIGWENCGAEYIMETTGAYVTTEKALAHLRAGAKKVFISAPAKDTETPTFVMGVNHSDYRPEMDIVSNASCTTNCLAPLTKIIEDNFGIEEALMSTIHAATAKQKVVDARSMKDWRTGRSVFGNIIPSTTGAAKAVGLVIPSLKGRITGMSFRVPTADVSVIDLTAHLKTPTDFETICSVIKKASETTHKGIVGYTDEAVVSADFIGEACTCVFDSTASIMINDHFVKLIAWYDNEWGYSNKLLDLAAYAYGVCNEARKG